MNSTRSLRSDVLRELVEDFGEKINLSTIKEVAEQQNYNVQKAKYVLQQMSALNNVTAATRNTNIFNRPEKRSRIPNTQSYNSTFAFEETIDDILRNYKILILLRGLPGSGKSYLSKSILNACFQNPDYHQHIFSADTFFMKSGRYVYDVSKIEDAHSWTKRVVFQKMLQGCSPLFVDNTNTRIWEMQPYAKMAAQCGYKIRVLDSNTTWSYDCRELEKKNIHGVPKGKLRLMLERFEKHVTPELLLTSCGLTLEYQINPQQRVFPPPISYDLFTTSNSSLGSGSIHNHNSLNQDLKLPVSVEITMAGTSRPTETCAVSTLIELSDDDDDANEKMPVEGTSGFSPQNLDLSAWGVSENALKSWGIASPLQEEKVEDSSIDLRPQGYFRFCNSLTSEQGTNTYLADFHRNSEDSKILFGNYRDINPPEKVLPLNRSGMLDKSCFTEEDLSSDRNEDLRKLTDIFQNIPSLHIRDMYDDCKGDFNMTMEIFLEDNKDYSNFSLSENRAPTPKELRMSYTSSNEGDSASSSSGVVETNEPREEHMHMPGTSNPQELPSGPSRENRNSESILIDSDSDLEFDNCQTPAESDTRSEENDNVELNLGNILIQQLEEQFGEPGHDYPKGFLPVVQVPKSFARQLYAFYVESVYQQMEIQKSVLDKLVVEDEAFARKLYEEENGLASEPKPEGLRDIMNEQVALNIHEREISQWKNHTPDSLADLLTEKKLIASFPTVDKNCLLEIFHAYGRDYNQTVDDLLVSVDVSEIRSKENLREPPISSTVLQEMTKANEACSTNQEEEGGTSESYREKANEYLKKRTELYQKAQEYYSKGQREVAQFYSFLAQRQTQFYDMANNRAATLLLEEHSHRLQNFDTLDLHFLFVKEAIPALDVFIDRNINLLKGSTKTSQNLLVITGRGNRSKNGVSRIRPAVMARLKTRKIQYVQLNPGLLKIKVNRDTIITSDL